MVHLKKLLVPAMLVSITFAISGCGLLFSDDLGQPIPTIDATRTEVNAGMSAAPGGDRFPDVLAVELRPQSDGTYQLAVTMSSPYDSPQRYADGWRVLDPAGDTLGTHMLMHDHAGEQPFTRTQGGLVIPAGVTEVTVEGRDQVNGYGGLTVTVMVPDA